jgi:DNA-binding transcriptional regulator YdaS (Cro superfamily)
MSKTTQRIKTDDAAKAFGSKRALAKALGITEVAVYQWKEYVPELRAFQLRELRPDLFK